MQKPQEQYAKTPVKPLRDKQSILVIDDSADMLMLQRSVLETEGYEVFTANSGARAFEVLSEIGAPELILLDVQMEDMSGLDFLEILEERFPEIIETVPVVFLTGMETVPKSKAVGFIRKPMDATKFLESIHRYIEMGTGYGPYKH